MIEIMDFICRWNNADDLAVNWEFNAWNRKKYVNFGLKGSFTRASTSLRLESPVSKSFIWTWKLLGRVTVAEPKRPAMKFESIIQTFATEMLIISDYLFKRIKTRSHLRIKSSELTAANRRIANTHSSDVRMKSPWNVNKNNTSHYRYW